jgi:hypothetical protein
MTSMAVPGSRTVRRRATAAARVRSDDAPTPWRRREAVVAALLGVPALTGMVVGWVGVSGTVRLSTQTRWLALGIGSLILAGFAMVGWLITGMVRITALRREVVATLTARSAVTQESATLAADRPAVYGVAPGMRRYHRPECRLLIDKRVTFDLSAAHAAAGRTPCGICTPPGTDPAA